MSRSAGFLASILAATTVALSLYAWHEHRQLDGQAIIVQKAELLESDNDSLHAALATAERKADDAQNAARRAQIERTVSAIRELPFKHPVVYETLDRAGIRGIVAGKLSEIYTDQEIRDMSTGYAAFGLLPPNYDLKQEYVNLLGEQIGAFYDQHVHKLFMFRDSTLENAQNRVILAHELTHALQDQNFGLLNMALEIKNNDDRAAAASALIEGDATLVMSQYMVSDMSWRTLADTAVFSATQSMVEMRRAPRFLREMLVFPYIQGQQFCSTIFREGGFPALSAVYRDPPSSTAQILHPDEYSNHEEPISIPIAETAVQGQKPLEDNVLGEMGCRILFSQYGDESTAPGIAAGWRGDRYLVYDGGKSLVWYTVWRDRAALQSALGALSAMCMSRFHIQVIRDGDELVASNDANHTIRIQVLNANEVVFILAPNQKSAQQLHNQFAGAANG
ncbi:MAG TPA: hypothetical protein VHY22_03310 [Chthoniobacteraceae bacterium]|jgi:hypothetical protein|nr:hypothetical protein [Chthoniobacteraceae bacterium]